jgi:hypothetical protein
MKKECEKTRQALPRYLHGHLFRTRRTRIERHLQQCVVCRSEYEALRRAEETRRILRDINAPHSVMGRMKEGVFVLSGLRKIFYRPLWIAGFVAAVAAVSYYVMTPPQLDVEIENIERTDQETSSPQADASAAPQNTAPPPPPATAAPASPAPPAELAPLAVTITPENDGTAIERINEVMHGHVRLSKRTFSDTVREVSGSLTVSELRTFLRQLEPGAKVSYSLRRLASFPTAEPVPFVLRLKAAPRAAEAPPTETAPPEPAAAQ